MPGRNHASNRYGRGICKEKDGKLTEIIESKICNEDDKFIAYPLENDTSFEVDKDSLVSMNMFAFTEEIFDYLEKGFKEFLEKNINDLTSEYLIPSYIFELIEKNIMEVRVLKTDAKWLGITYKEDKQEVVNAIKDMIDKGIYKENLWD